MVPDGQPVGGAGNGAVLGRRVRLRADRELDRGVRPADAGQSGDRFAVADLRRVHPRHRLHDRGANGRDRTRVDRRVSGGACPGGEMGREESSRKPSSRRRTPTPQRPSTSPTVAPMRPLPPRLAAQRHGLEVLAAGVVDEPNARTRFVLAGRSVRRRARTNADRTSVVLRLDNVPGALAVSAGGVRDPRHRPDPDRIAAHPNRTGHIHLLSGLRRPRR